MGSSFLKDLSQRVNQPQKKLAAMVPDKDPFYAGNDTTTKQAEWASDLFSWVREQWDTRKRTLERAGVYLGDKPHNRGIHYLLLSGYTNPKTWRGVKYIGNEKQWKELCACFKFAKILGYIPWGAVEDHRHPDIITNLMRVDDDEIPTPFYYPTYTITRDDADVDISHTTPCLDTDELARYLDVDSRIPVHLEIWVEKPRDIYRAIAQQYHVNLQLSKGVQNPENIYSMLERAAFVSKGRPIRILYVSDFDPSGEIVMPQQVSRWLEWMHHDIPEFNELDIKLKKVLLKQDQLEGLELADVKPKDSMGPRWNQYYGGKICELDALDTLKPERAIRVLREEITRYIPDDIVKSIKDHNDAIGAAIAQYNSDAQARLAKASEPIEEQIDIYLDHLFESIIKDDINVDLGDIHDKYMEVVESWEEPEWEFDDGTGQWLYDSSRDYLRQLSYYKRLKENCLGGLAL